MTTDESNVDNGNTAANNSESKAIVTFEDKGVSNDFTKAGKKKKPPPVDEDDIVLEDYSDLNIVSKDFMEIMRNNQDEKEALKVLKVSLEETGKRSESAAVTLTRFARRDTELSSIS